MRISVFFYMLQTKKGVFVNMLTQLTCNGVRAFFLLVLLIRLGVSVITVTFVLIVVFTFTCCEPVWRSHIL